MAAVLRGVFGYCFLVLMMRVAGRRPGKQMAPADFILIFFSGGLALTPMVGDDRSLVNALTIILSIAATHYAIAWLKQRSPGFGRVVDGTPLVLLAKGQWQTTNMKKMRIVQEDVLTAVRDQGVANLDKVDYVLLERNGELSVISAEE